MVIIAYLTMIVDHVFKYLAPAYYSGVPIVGRIAMPLFAYMLVSGMIKTRSRSKYIFRLGIFALVSQIPYILMIRGLDNFNIMSLDFVDKITHTIVYFTKYFNIGFVFFLGAITIDYFETYREKGKKINVLNAVIIILLASYISQVLKFDGGTYSYLLILLMYITYNVKKTYLLLGMIALNFIYIFQNSQNIEQMQINMIQMFSLFVIPIIIWVKEKKPIKRLRLLKYSIYPVHMLLIFIFRDLFFLVP